MQPGKSVRFGRSAVPFGGSLRSEEPQAAVLKKSTHLHSEAELESVGVCHSWASLCVLVGLLAPSGGRFAPRCGGLATAQFVEGKPSAHKPHCTAVGLPFCAYSRQLSIPCSCATVAAFGAALHGNPSAVCASLCCSLRWGSFFLLHPSAQKQANPPASARLYAAMLPLSNLCSFVAVCVFVCNSGSRPNWPRTSWGDACFLLFTALGKFVLQLSEVRTKMSVPLYRTLCFCLLCSRYGKNNFHPSSYRNSFFALLRRP